MPKKLVAYINFVFVIILKYSIARINTMRSPMKQRTVIINLEKNFLSRRLYNICYYFLQNNYTVYLSIKPKFLYSLKEYDKNLLWLKGICFKRLNTRVNTLTYSNNIKGTHEQLNIKHGIEYYTNAETDTSFHIPIGMYPVCYKQKLHKKKLGNTPQVVKIVFIGYTNNHKYNRQ